ncbi:hypothetical protein [Bradyrhizobium sp. WSM3983]|uniref:hypothetical protein n=1 Tax=Bradyrhizobium sp. WSM3983 TaxID=1038867 RepID=UPI0012EC5E2F|nr:hypothetical protein [Bradyrhizobium sp. WSM3983]
MSLGERFSEPRSWAFEEMFGRGQCASRPMACWAVVLVGSLVPIAISGEAAAQLFTAPVMIDHFQDVPSPVPPPALASPVPFPKPAAPPPTPQAERDTSPNPLWTIPVLNLKATRERPLFSPTRHLAPLAKAPPSAPPAPPPLPRPPEPEKLQLTLIGTVVGEGGQSLGLFVNSADNSSVKLKIGDSHQGWVLRELSPYRAKLDKGPQSTALEFPRSVPKRDVAAVAPPVPTPPAAIGQPSTAVAPINIVRPQPPAAPQVNPFQKFWSR